MPTNDTVYSRLFHWRCAVLLVSMPGQKFEISIPAVPPIQLSYDEYADYTVSGKARGRTGHLSSYAMATKMK